MTDNKEDLMGLVNSCDVVQEAMDRARVEGALLEAERLRGYGLLAAAAAIESRARLKDRLARLAEGRYIRITQKKIMDFLAKKADDYNRLSKKEKQAAEQTRLKPGTARLVEFAESVDRSIRELCMSRLDAFSMQSLAGTFLASPYPAPGSIVHSAHQQNQQQYQRAATDDVLKSTGIGQYVWEEVPISDYKGVPPDNVLLKLVEEKAKNLFDTFKIASVKAIPDPLLLGCVDGIEDRFFLAQWGDDVSLDDII